MQKNNHNNIMVFFRNVIASGGAGKPEHFYDALTQGKADAALAASLFHYKELEIADLKKYLAQRGVSVRM